MPTVPIEVKTYKAMYRILEAVYLALNENGEAGEILERFPDIAHPDWICDHCGYDQDCDFEDSHCPRCEHKPLS